MRLRSPVGQGVQADPEVEIAPDGRPIPVLRSPEASALPDPKVDAPRTRRRQQHTQDIAEAGQLDEDQLRLARNLLGRPHVVSPPPAAVAAQRLAEASPSAGRVPRQPVSDGRMAHFERARQPQTAGRPRELLGDPPEQKTPYRPTGARAGTVTIS